MPNYILNSSNRTHGYNFFHNRQNGICYHHIKNGKISPKYESVIYTDNPDFAVCMDSADMLHLLCLDNNQNLIYFVFNGKYWQQKVVLRSKNSGNCHISDIKIFSVQNIINFFYVLHYDNKKYLIHQTMHNLFATPNVVGLISDNVSFNVEAKDTGFLRAFYKSQQHDNSFGFNEYDIKNDKWSSFKMADPVASDPQGRDVGTAKADSLDARAASKASEASAASKAPAQPASAKKPALSTSISSLEEKIDRLTKELSKLNYKLSSVRRRARIVKTKKSPISAAKKSAK